MMNELHQRQKLRKSRTRSDGMIQILDTLKYDRLRQSLASNMATSPAPASFNGKVDVSILAVRTDFFHVSRGYIDTLNMLRISSKALLSNGVGAMFPCTIIRLLSKTSIVLY
jgi:hypothetical protein